VLDAVSRSHQTSGVYAGIRQEEMLMEANVQPLVVREPGARALTGLGRSRLLELAYAGRIPSFKVGRSRFFPVAGLERWVQDQVEAGEAQVAE
jgi:Helix-turn-helix domain